MFMCKCINDEKLLEVVSSPEKRPTKGKRRLQLRSLLKKGLSPTAALELQKLRHMVQLERSRAEKLEEVKMLEEANKVLKEDKEFLLHQLKPTQAPQMKRKKQSEEVSSDDELSSSSFHSSSTEEEEMPKKKKKRTHCRREDDSPRFEKNRTRMNTIEGVIHWYRSALKSYKRCGSMKRAFAHERVDRNTIARTAPIAEIAIAFPDAFADVPEWDGAVEKMASYADRCRKAISEDMAGKIKAMKNKGQLLPIVYKYT
ncbi:coiled-coil domain-containing protein 106-like [Anguilla anguilla]|uniref:coiled-coil domain-containing protein 106-like n=1 Tax=Anguilla anguilla TaxID=7936 RepID=UPI0015B08661|nr:coiled-coil domain-containing protein 106-like [Anguilla anguilla]